MVRWVICQDDRVPICAQVSACNVKLVANDCPSCFRDSQQAHQCNAAIAIRMHLIHHPNRNYDLNTLYCMTAMEKGMHCLHKLSLPEAHAMILNEECHNSAKHIMSTLLFVAIIAHMTSHPMGPESWCKNHCKKSDLSDTVKQPFFPDCVMADMEDFSIYLKRTSTDKYGRIGRMTQWMGQGDAMLMEEFEFDSDSLL